MDYLDPIGESPLDALERRLKWAERSVEDPALAEEARFLLDHAEDLREIARASVVDEEWMDEPVGDYGDIPEIREVAPRHNTMREDLSDTIFGEDDDEAQYDAPIPRAKNPGPAQSGIMRLEDLTDRPALSRAAAPALPVFRDPWEDEGEDEGATVIGALPQSAEKPPPSRGSLPPGALGRGPVRSSAASATPRPAKRAAVPRSPLVSMEADEAGEADAEDSSTLLVRPPVGSGLGAATRDAGRTIVPDDLDEEIPASEQRPPSPVRLPAATPVSSAQAVPRRRDDASSPAIRAPIRQRPRSAGPMIGGVLALGLLLGGGYYALQALNGAPVATRPELAAA
ncbi:MAG: hypothetical protein H0V89_05370, partial [Deltaproteobacteria bacterium]|nr:hypothetical protein [Deltaproteobacteria bacterium]